MRHFFYPKDDIEFKENAVGNYVRTIVINSSGEIIESILRKVKVRWKQTRKNNIETDHRIKSLNCHDCLVYSWVCSSMLVLFDNLDFIEE